MAETDVRSRPRGREDLEKWYSEALDRQESEGLSVAAVAEDLGVTATTLYSWRRRLRKRERTVAAHRAPLPGLVEVAVAPPGAEESPSRFAVHLANERTIEVPPSFSTAGLRRLVEALESC